MKNRLIILTGVFLLSGCSLFSADNNSLDNHPELLAYKFRGKIEASQCFVESLPDEKLYNFDRNNYEYRFVVRDYALKNTADCKNIMQNTVVELCRVNGGVMRDDWCDRYDNYPIFFFYNNNRMFTEVVTGREATWLDRARIGGFVDIKYEAEKARLEQVRKLQLAAYKENYEKVKKGNPSTVLKAEIGSRICKLDTKLTYSGTNPESYTYFVGYLEKKSKSNILVRYDSHRSDIIYYDDMNGKVNWSPVNGWFLCG